MHFFLRLLFNSSFVLILCFQFGSGSSHIGKHTGQPVTNFQEIAEITEESQDSVCPLDTYYDKELEAKLLEMVSSKIKWQQLVNDERMCIGVVDLKDMDNPRFASINGEVMMYAASLPKIAVLLAAEDAIEKKEIEHTAALEKDMRLMISKSNNQATTRIIDQLGYEKIESVVRDERYSFYNPEEGGGLWVGKRYAAGGPTNREPMKNLSHAATADQVCRFYYLLVNRQLVSPERSEHMLKMLEAPELNHKFVYALRQIDPEAKLYRKSGTWRNWHADSILVMGETRKYILVALLQDAAGESIIRDLVFPMDRAIIK